MTRRVDAGGRPLENLVRRLVIERDNAYGAGAERASESDSRHPANGDPYTTGPTLPPRGPTPEA